MIAQLNLFYVHKKETCTGLKEGKNLFSLSMLRASIFFEVVFKKGGWMLRIMRVSGVKRLYPHHYDPY